LILTLSCKTLLDDIVNTVNELVFQAVSEIETALLNVPKEQLGFPASAPQDDDDDKNEEDASEQAARTEIEAGIVKLESLLYSTIDKNFDKLEIYTLRNLLTVSNAKEDEGLEQWIVLDHYKDLQPPSTDANAPTPESVNHLRRKVQETEKLQSALQAEVAQNEALLAQMRSLMSTTSPPTNKAERSLAFLTNTPSAAALGVGSSRHANTLAQNTSFVYSQIPALREIVTALRAHLETLPAKNMAATISQSTETRHAYIESQTQRALDRAGVDASIAPDAEALGRRMGGDETRALESIVAAMADQNKTRHDAMQED
jgi:kinetochore protein Mis12/MTW1